jgi:transcriptional regulator with XRE-family HTH domain
VSPTVAQTVKRRREALGLSQVALAKQAKVSQSFLSRLEAGDYAELSLPVALRLAKVLKIDVAKLAE